MKVIHNAENIVKLLRQNICPSSLGNNYSFYNSLIKGITTDPVFMTVPLDDKIIHRAFGVYDTLTVTNSCIYNFDKKVNALYSYAKALKLHPPFDIPYAQAVAIALIKAAKKENCQVTMWMSPGPGDYSLIMNPKNPVAFYALCHKSIDMLPSGAFCETRSITTGAPIKTTNYVTSTLNSTEAKLKGGYLGIMIDKNEYVLEATIANVGILLKSGELLIPPFDDTLAGTTALRLIEYAKEELIPKGIIKGLRREKIKLRDAKSLSKEVMLLGGNACVPILQWDEDIISPKPGHVTMIIQKFFKDIDCKAEAQKI